MSDRSCVKCGRTIKPGVSGNLCLKCQLDASSESGDRSPHDSDSLYDVSDMAQKMGLVERTVRRKARDGNIPGRVPGIKRYLFNKDVVDEWLSSGQPIARTPTTPLQEKAFAMCRRHDHSWLADEEYAGNSYLRETRVDKGDSTFTVGFVHTCYFCGHQEYFYY